MSQYSYVCYDDPDRGGSTPRYDFTVEGDVLTFTPVSDGCYDTDTEKSYDRDYVLQILQQRQSELEQELNEVKAFLAEAETTTKFYNEGSGEPYTAEDEEEDDE